MIVCIISVSYLCCSVSDDDRFWVCPPELITIISVLDRPPVHREAPEVLAKTDTTGQSVTVTQEILATSAEELSASVASTL